MINTPLAVSIFTHLKIRPPFIPSFIQMGHQCRRTSTLGSVPLSFNSPSFIEYLRVRRKHSPNFQARSQFPNMADVRSGTNKWDSEWVDQIKTNFILNLFLNDSCEAFYFKIGFHYPIIYTQSPRNGMEPSSSSFQRSCFLPNSRYVVKVLSREPHFRNWYK